MGRTLDGLHVYFELRYEHAGLPDVPGCSLYLSGPVAAVCAGGDDDGILAVGGDGNKGRTGWQFREFLYSSRIYPVVAEVFDELRAERVLAHPAEHGYLSAQPCGGDGLVRTLAAGEEGKSGVGDRLARLRAALDPEHKVLIDRTDD